MDSFLSFVTHVGAVLQVVNNGGRSQRGLIETTPLQIDREMLELNLVGTLSFTKAVVPYFIKQRHGHFVNTSSAAGIIGSPCSASYSCTKAAMNGFFNALRNEMEVEHNVFVTNVCPGYAFLALRQCVLLMCICRPVESEITEHAFTERPGEELGIHGEGDTKRVSAERCAHLMAAAMYARLPECWVSPQPVRNRVYR